MEGGGRGRRLAGGGGGGGGEGSLKPPIQAKLSSASSLVCVLAGRSTWHG